MGHARTVPVNVIVGEIGREASKRHAADVPLALAASCGGKLGAAALMVPTEATVTKTTASTVDRPAG